MNKKILIIVVIVVALVGAGAWYLLGLINSGNQSTAGCPTPAAKTVSFCGGKFNAITVASGDSVTFKNDSTEQVDVESDPHPVHTINPELNIGSINPGQTKTVTLTKKGTWGFHNHLNFTEHGSITVN